MSFNSNCTQLNFTYKVATDFQTVIMIVRDSFDSVAPTVFLRSQSLDSIDLQAPNYHASTQLPGEPPSAMPVLKCQASTQVQGTHWLHKRFDRFDFTNDSIDLRYGALVGQPL